MKTKNNKTIIMGGGCPEYNKPNKENCKHLWIGTSEAGIVSCVYCHKTRDLRKEDFKNDKKL